MANTLDNEVGDMDRDQILNGIHIGEHSFDPDNVINEIYERCVVPGLNFVTIRTRRGALSDIHGNIIKHLEIIKKLGNIFNLYHSFSSLSE